MKIHCIFSYGTYNVYRSEQTDNNSSTTDYAEAILMWFGYFIIK